MCKYCENKENVCVTDGYIIIEKDKNSPSGYSLAADNSNGEYAECRTPIYYCPKCGRKLEKMEGLCLTDKKGNSISINEQGQIIINPKNKSTMMYSFSEIIKELDKLTDYEDAEESGLLIRLPLHVGDKLWHNYMGKAVFDIVDGFYCNSQGEWYIELKWERFLLSDFGKTVFLTKEEAEKALEGMNNADKCE